MSYFYLLAIGLVAGVFSGMFGIGGGLIIGPALILIMKMPMKHALATSLAAIMLPVAFPAALAHYKAGNINIKYAAVVAVGILVASYFGAEITINISTSALRRAYAVFLLVIAIRFLLMGK